MYHYIAAVLHSPIGRLFPGMCNYEMIYFNYTAPAVLGRFPIVFPESNQTEDLINTISSYLMCLNRQIYTADYGVADWLQELEENIRPFDGDIKSENDDSLLNTLYCIKKQILETSRLGKYRFKMGLHDILRLSCTYWLVIKISASKVIFFFALFVSIFL